MKNDTIITGASGMVGSAFRKVSSDATYLNRKEFHSLACKLMDIKILNRTYNGKKYPSRVDRN